MVYSIPRKDCECVYIVEIKHSRSNPLEYLKQV